MPSIEKVDYQKAIFEQTNISQIVGAGEKNEKNDVMLIQTLFRLVGFKDRASNMKFGFPKKYLPEPTGILDANTIHAIWGFQRKMAHRLLNVDGKIHPASYTDRRLKVGPGERQMMITLLNMEALDQSIMYFGIDLITAIKHISPNISFALNN